MTLTAIACVRTIKWDGNRAVQRQPGVGLDICPQRGLQLLVWIVAPGEVAVANEERGFVVTRVDHPQRDLPGTVAANLTGRGIIDVDALEVDD
jgi:hypothetical protein